jgi:hypothetical protein
MIQYWENIYPSSTVLCYPIHHLFSDCKSLSDVEKLILPKLVFEWADSSNRGWMIYTGSRDDQKIIALFSGILLCYLCFMISFDELIISSIRITWHKCISNLVKWMSDKKTSMGNLWNISIFSAKTLHPSVQNNMFCTTLLHRDNIILQSPICLWFSSRQQA